MNKGQQLDMYTCGVCHVWDSHNICEKTYWLKSSLKSLAASPVAIMGVARQAQISYQPVGDVGCALVWLHGAAKIGFSNRQQQYMPGIQRMPHPQRSLDQSHAQPDEPCTFLTYQAQGPMALVLLPL